MKLFSHTSTLILSGIDLLSDMIKGHTDARMMSAANLDNIFSDGQFLIES